VILIKIGGSLITDKTKPLSYRQDVMLRIAQEIARIRQEKPDIKMIIGHGSGSFGHVVAQQYQTISGVKTSEEWVGFAEVARIAGELTTLVWRSFEKADVTAMRFSPSISALAQDGRLIQMSLDNIHHALANDILPFVHGDVAFDLQRGGTIVSTETVFAYLCQRFDIERVILLGEVDGVLDKEQKVIPRISHNNIEEIKPLLKPSRGTDVTGGMITKVNGMLELAHQFGVTVHIINGLAPDLLYKFIVDEIQIGTTISSD